MGDKTFDRSFASGELAPEMFGRIDLSKYQSGLALCKNCITLPHGPVANRAGTEFVSLAASQIGQVRLIPFTYSFDQTMVIEIGAGYFQFYTNGRPLMNGPIPYTVSNTYTSADLMGIKFTQSADVMTLTHPNYPISELQRLGALNWTFTQPYMYVPMNSPTSCGAVVTSPHTTNWNPTSVEYAATSVSPDLQESVASTTSGLVSNDLTLAGNYNTISIGAPYSGYANPVRFNVYKKVNGLWGFIGQAAVQSGLLGTFIDNNITPNAGITPPIHDADFNTNYNLYPSACGYFQQRRIFAATYNKPQNVWMTVSGTESNLAYHLPVMASDRVAFRIAAREATGIQHIVPVASLVLLTASCEWVLSASDNSAIWSGNVNVRPQSYVGCSSVTPVVVGNTILFAQARGGRIREMSYTWQSQTYQANDICVLAPHLFDYSTIADMCFSRAPYPILWAASSNGKLLGMTYLPEQEIAAWHQHDVGGMVMSVCTITEKPAGALAAEDMLYMVVRRIINGAMRQCIERLHTRFFNSLSDAFFVDCGGSNAVSATYSAYPSLPGVVVAMCSSPNHGYSNGASLYLTFSNPALSGQYSIVLIDANTFSISLSSPAIVETGTVSITPTYQVSTISGLTWLEGATVSILADGAVMPQQVVSATGTITLPYPATKVIVGLPITSQIQTLPATLQIDAAAGETVMKNVNAVWLRVSRSAGMSAGPDFQNQTGVIERTAADLPGNPPALYTGMQPVALTPEWSTDGAICIQQTDPLPMTITSIAADISLR